VMKLFLDLLLLEFFDLPGKDFFIALALENIDLFGGWL